MELHILKKKHLLDTFVGKPEYALSCFFNIKPLDRYAYYFH